MLKYLNNSLFEKDQTFMGEPSVAELQYPVGKFKRSEGTLNNNLRNDYITAIQETPLLFRKAIEGFSEEQLDTPYRPGGWTVRQLIHHMADSHMNSFIRFKLALTEENPVIKPYEEKLWAETPEVFSESVETSLMLLEVLHKRWVTLLKSLEADQLQRSFQHPVSGKMTLDQALAMYAWHCKHHLAHILRLKERNNW